MDQFNQEKKIIDIRFLYANIRLSSKAA